MSEKKIMNLKCEEDAHLILKKLSVETSVRMVPLISRVIKAGVKVIRQEEKVKKK